MAKVFWPGKIRGKINESLYADIFRILNLKYISFQN
jgi:hypothetical protein